MWPTLLLLDLHTCYSLTKTAAFQIPHISQSDVNGKTYTWPRRVRGWVWSPGLSRSLERAAAAHSDVLAWRIHGQGVMMGYSPWVCKELVSQSNNFIHAKEVRRLRSGTGKQSDKFWKFSIIGISITSLDLLCLKLTTRNSSVSLTGLNLYHSNESLDSIVFSLILYFLTGWTTISLTY